jgi:hypothetical protein
VQLMKENGLITEHMVLGNLFMQWGISMKDIGIETKHVEWELILVPIQVALTLEYGKMIYSIVEESKHGKTKVLMMENSIWVKNVELGSRYGKMVLYLLVTGKII